MDDRQPALSRSRPGNPRPIDSMKLNVNGCRDDAQRFFVRYVRSVRPLAFLRNAFNEGSSVELGFRCRSD